MSSENMRSELESFVNIGLQYGWRGWPRKSAACHDWTLGGRWVACGSHPGGRIALTNSRTGGDSDSLSKRFDLLY